MKKRLRKKKHVGEFARYGIIVAIEAINGCCEDVCEKVCDFAEKNEVCACGGGQGVLVMPHTEVDATVPTVCEALLLGLMQSGRDEPMTFCFYPSDNKHIDKNVLVDFSKTFPDSNYRVKIGKAVNIWKIA